MKSRLRAAAAEGCKSFFGFNRLVMVRGESLSEVLKNAEQAGLRISRETPARRHRRGLIPQPLECRHLGYRRGTETIYPLHTTRQLIASERLFKKFGADYQRIGWLLWAGEFPVRSNYWQEPLQSARDQLLKLIDLVADCSEAGTPIISDAAFEIIDAITKSRNKLCSMGTIRRRLHRDKLETALRVVFEVLIGVFRPAHQQPECDKVQATVVARMIGLVAAAKKRKQPLLIP